MRSIPAALVILCLLAACGGGGPVQDPTPLTDLSTIFTYPVSLWDDGVDGQTTLMVHVTDTGAVDTAYVSTSSGYAVFDSAALADVRQARFSPAVKGDRRIDMWVRLPVVYQRPKQQLGQKAKTKQP